MTAPITLRGALTLVLAVLLTATAAAQDAPAPATASLNPLATLDLEALSATRELPLFTPSRSAPVVEEYVEPPPAEAAPEPVAEEAPPPALKLVGIVMAESGQTAILSDEATGEIRRLSSGTDVDGWTLSIVDARSVAFTMAEREHKLTLFEPGSEIGRPDVQPDEPQIDPETGLEIDPQTGMPIDPGAQYADDPAAQPAEPPPDELPDPEGQPIPSPDRQSDETSGVGGANQQGDP